MKKKQNYKGRRFIIILNIITLTIALVAILISALVKLL
jgi:hypothetical protein